MYIVFELPAFLSTWPALSVAEALARR